MAEPRTVSSETFKALVKDAKFICKRCGRTAAKKREFCEPERLSSLSALFGAV